MSLGSSLLSSSSNIHDCLDEFYNILNSNINFNSLLYEMYQVDRNKFKIKNNRAKIIDIDELNSIKKVIKNFEISFINNTSKFLARDRNISQYS